MQAAFTSTCIGCDRVKSLLTLWSHSGYAYRSYSKLRTRTAVVSYSRPIPRSIEPS